VIEPGRHGNGKWRKLWNDAGYYVLWPRVVEMNRVRRPSLSSTRVEYLDLGKHDLL
jgi:hypothetical protein